MTNHIVNTTFVSLLAWPDPDRDCDLRRVSTTIGDRDRLGLGYELYITPVVGVGDADFHHHRCGGRRDGPCMARSGASIYRRTRGIGPADVKNPIVWVWRAHF